MPDKFIYKCNDCGEEYPGGTIKYLCPECNKSNRKNQPSKGVLKTIFDYEAIKHSYNFPKLKEEAWLPLLAIKSLQSWPKLRIGKTPLYHFPTGKNKNTNLEFWLKDDSQNPSFSFKDRASALVSAFAIEQDIDTIVAASTGNAGSSLACICANQGQKAIVMVPANAPKAKLAQIVMYGAEIIMVDGTYDDAFDLSIEASKKHGWYNRNTAYNPLTIEGKKIVAYEIFDQLDQKLPDRIFVPVGDGVILSGIYKGFEDLLLLEMIDKIPEIVGVQSAGSANLANNLHTKTFEFKPSKTIADSISVDIPRNFYMAKKFIQQYEGKMLVVSDEEITSASVKLAANTGIFAEPAAAASYAGFLKYKSLADMDQDATNLILSTGSGLKDPEKTIKGINT